MMTSHNNDNLIRKLRELRKQARILRATLTGDLASFQKEEDGSFYTLPDSDKIGISIASSCTAIMALADSGKFDDLDPTRFSARAQSTADEKKVSQPVAKASVERTNASKTLDSDSSPKDTALNEAGENVSKSNDQPSSNIGGSVQVMASQVKVDQKDWAVDLFSNIVKAKWETSGLDDLNAFSACMVMRAAGFMVSSGKITTENIETLMHSRPAGKEPVGAVAEALKDKQEISLKDIALKVAQKAPKSFSVKKYPAKTTMAYWFTDGISRAKIDLGKYWVKIAKWAVHEFQRQLSYVVSGNDALMDPAELAMAACLINRVRRSCSGQEKLAHICETLPSSVELLHAIHKVFSKQADSGIWHKYFPLFHFPGSGAADYCFSFEFLEAILIEFASSDILIASNILDGMSKAVQWCETNRLHFRNYSGWNAGGDVNKLTASMPEAWATASVHMFLWELDFGLSASLQNLILGRFPRVESPPRQKWDELIDVKVFFPGEETTLKDITEKELIVPASNRSEESVRKTGLSSRRSALLFGPPGTSKSSFAKALAGRLEWPLVVITPSEFLSKGLEQIYGRATEIFEDLMDLAHVVVFFDEMDALAQTRGNSTLDVTRQLLTTSMLPKLGDLYEHGRIIFLMATNHKKDLDPAIIRPARFDLLLCVGPPNWAYKLKGIQYALKGLPVGDLEILRSRLNEFSNSLAVREQLDIFTVGDLRSLLESIRRKMNKESIASALDGLGSDKFQAEVASWFKSYITLAKSDVKPSEEMNLLSEYENDKNSSRIQ